MINLCIYKESENLKTKYERDMEVLRNERVALEEVITTLRAECDNFKQNLNKEFETNDNLKLQLNRLSKETKDFEEVRFLFFFCY
jgi:regulator of replication initiation timing